ncbi:lasso RiPP family leader peptide-containing protein [Streptomyces sp. NPDC093085]
MENTSEVYEVPTVVEVGEYAELTLGETIGYFPDGGTPPFNRFAP